jgi:Flp pilus assembly protein TadG
MAKLMTIKTRRRMKGIAALNAFIRHTEGVAAIEMAFIFPFMVLLYIGLVDVTNLISANRRVTIAASTLADLVTQQSTTTITKSEISGFFSAIEPIIEPFDESDVGAEIFGYTKNGSSAKLNWQTSNGSSCGSTPSTSGLVNLMSAGNDLVTARVCINYKPLFSYVLGSNPFQPEHQLTLRPRQNTTLTCTNC